MSDYTRRFSNRVDYYVRSRPKYPAELLRFLQTELDLKSDDTVADIGSGTGFLTELFLQNGNVTFAVEPNDEMRGAAEKSLLSFSNFRSVNATAEATSLAESSIDLITAAQAFHWFDPLKTRKEFKRISKPGGHVALVWNEREADLTATTRAYSELIRDFELDRTDQRRRSMQGTDPAVLREFFLPGVFQVREFDNPQFLDLQGLLDRVASSSYMPLPGQPRYADLELRTVSLFEGHQNQGRVRIDQKTRVYFGFLP